MSTGLHRLTVVACALSWFLVGMHSPVLHELIDHGQVPHGPVLALLVVFTLAGCGSLWMLLRRRSPWTAHAASGPRAT